VDIWSIIIVVIILVFLIIFVVDRVVVAHKRQATTGREDLIGKSVVVRKSLNPAGTVFLEGEIWQAVIDEGSAESGEYVVIIKSDGLKLYVSKNNKGGN